MVSLWDKHGSLRNSLNFNAFRCRWTPCFGPCPYTFSRQMKSTWCWSTPAIPVSDEPDETIWCTVNAALMCQNTFKFFDSVIMLRHHFTGNGKVICILQPRTKLLRHFNTISISRHGTIVSKRNKFAPLPSPDAMLFRLSSSSVHFLCYRKQHCNRGGGKESFNLPQ